MPPRLPASCSARRNRCLDDVLIAASGTATATGRPSWPLSRTSSPWTMPCSASFSTTTPREISRNRKRFIKWIATDAERYKYKKPGERPGPVYLSQSGATTREGKALQPFLQNPEFVSQPVLSEVARNLIWDDVMVRGLPLKAVSARRNVDMLRVAAVIRMKTIEKQWAKEGKQVAEDYSNTILSMLPNHNLEVTDAPFEPINEVYVHSRTQQQLFVPTSESRQFTRADAAKAFGDTVLPPDEKIRIPELITFEKDLAKGMDTKEARVSFLVNTSKSEKELAAKMARRQQNDEEKRLRIKTSRFEFRFEDVNADAVGKNGRSRLATGWRYGVPHGDRRRGAVKIPTKVE